MRLNYFIKILSLNFRFGFIPASGRNFLGHICTYHRGGADKRRLFYVDFKRRINMFGYICKIQKSSFFSGFLGLIIYQNGLSSYILLSDNPTIGDCLYLGCPILDDTIQIYKGGYSLPIAYISLFALVSNIEGIAYKGGQFARAAGTSAMIVTKHSKQVVIKLKSGWHLTLADYNICSLGILSNPGHRFESFRKAGAKRHLGFRPVVRGVAMNPCDHPHGGGEGRKSPPSAPRSPWGWLTKNTPSLITKGHLSRRKRLKSIKS